MAIVTQPGRALVNSNLAPALTVEVRDSIDRRIATATTAVTIGLGANPGAATLSGSTSVNAASGVATFNNLKLNQRGRGYTLVASSGALQPDTSSTFDVMAPLVVDAVAAGSDHACGLKLGVAMYCWGEGSSGELGDGAAVDRPFAVVVTGGLQFVKIAGGFAQTCGITGAGAAYCWGQNLSGKVGDSSFTDRSLPTAVFGGHTFADAPTPGFFHSCGLGSTGTSYCWGGNNVGQLGDSTRNQSYVPVAAVGGLTFLVLHTANFHTCGITVAHLAYCWGSNVQGGLGDSTNVEKLAPEPVKGSLTFSTIATGSAITCGLTLPGAAYCWGGTTTPDHWVPVAVPGAPTFSALSVGGVFACGMTADSLAYCWGQIPGGGNPTPVPVSQTLRFTTMAAGFNHACGVTRAGLVYCWGTNPRGQLGDGTTNSSAVPIRVDY